VVLACGQLSLGQAAFMGLGAYSSALLPLQSGLPFWAVLPLSCVAPVAFALLIGPPTLRLSGVYLAIATIGLGEVLRALYLNSDFLGGALGLSGIPADASPGLIYLVLLIAFAALWRLARSPAGRAMEAIRQDATAAEIAGIPVSRYQLAVLVASAVLAGLAGALDAHSTSFIGPNEYGFDTAIAVLSYALLGGIGSPAGPVLGAVLLTLLPEMVPGAAQVRPIASGVVIVAAVLFLPHGLLPWRLRRA